MGSFLSGALQGFSTTAMQRKKQDGSAKKKSPTQQVNEEAASRMMDDDPHKRMMSYKRGGKVRGKKGKPVVIKAHAGERVLTAKQTKKYDSQHKIGKRRGRRRASKRR